MHKKEELNLNLLQDDRLKETKAQFLEELPSPPPLPQTPTWVRVLAGVGALAMIGLTIFIFYILAGGKI